MGHDVDVLIVGGGIVGCALAFYLGRVGADVLLIERDALNCGASGANAGSLHLQLTAPFFAQTPRERAAASASTMIPLALQAAQAWRELSRDLDRDIELTIGGGLMVAETDEQLRFLRDKARIERAAGLEAEILSRSDLRAIAPYLSDELIGAELCPGEGKVNPLAATLALADAAIDAGVELRQGVALVQLKRQASGFLAVTRQGPIRCRRVVNAAGSLAGRIAGMVATRLPVAARAQHMNATEPTRALVSHLVQHAGRRLTLKQASNGSIIVGGGLPARVDRASGCVSVVRESVERSLGAALGVLPALASLRLIRAWASEALITDGNPILGEHPAVAGFYNAVPASSGYTTGPVCARLLAELLLGQRTADNLHAFSIARFPM